MRTFITTQKKLAEAASVSPEYLSAAKGGRGISDSLAIKLEDITGIKHSIWVGASRRTLLNKKLKSFFLKEKKDQASYER